MFQKLLTATFFVLLSGPAFAGRNPDDKSFMGWWNDYEFGNNLETWVMCISLLIFIGSMILVSLDKKNEKDK